jgi:anti-anti-sigma regulatory factor
MEKAHPLDSSAIGEIILGYSKLRECGKMLRLFSLTKHGEHILRLTQIDRIIKIHPNEQDALERFRK